MIQLELFDIALPQTEAVLPCFPVPKNDNEQLLQWQYEYLAEGNQDSLSRIWQLSVTLCGKFIRKEQKKKGLVFDSDYIEDLKVSSAEYVLRRYSTTPGYFIAESFTSELYYGVKHALYYRTRSDIVWNEAVKMMNESSGLSFETALQLSKREIEKAIKKKHKTTEQGQLLLFKEIEDD